MPDLTVNISRHFRRDEFLRSSTAARHGIDMSPPLEVQRNLIRLAVLVLDPIRDAAQVPIIITSGYRPRALNQLVGGSLNSDHIRGLAADIIAYGLSLDQLGNLIRSLDLPLRKAIYEFGEWIHVSVAPDGEAPRREFLVARRERNQTIYEKWA